MHQKITLKRLTASDLTFFEWQFRNHNAGNQKAINLNADVFVQQLFPAIEAAARGTEGKIPLDLWIFGPGSAGPINLQRKIIKGAAYKNWRLDGEFVANPFDDPDRFNVLNVGDFAVIAFEGDVAPTSAKAIFVANAHPEDATLHSVLDDVLGTRTMMTLEENSIDDIRVRSGLSDDHPLVGIALNQDLQEAVIGNAAATERVLRSGRITLLSAADLRRARERAEEIGNLGEALVAVYFEKMKAAGKLEAFEWVSATNAIAPLDFTCLVRGSTERLDVKTTSGLFNREFHVSYSELREMASGDGPYRIFRVYEATPEGAKLRISDDMMQIAKKVLEAFDGLPEGITPDGISIKPDGLMFASGIELEPGDDEGEGWA